MAIGSDDMDIMWNTIQQYIYQYGQDWSHLPGVQIQRVDSDTYAQLSAIDLIQQLHCIIALVYKDTGLKSVNREVFCECFKCLLKRSKLLTDKELDAIFAFA